MLFTAQQLIAGRYTVVFPIKRGAYAETYRVRTAEGRRCFLKLIDTSAGGSHEADILEQLHHPNLPVFIERGEVEAEGRRMEYVVTDYLSSETLADRLARTATLTAADTRQVATALLRALHYLHTLPEPIIHNEVTATNTLVDLTTDDLTRCRLIDLGHATPAGRAPIAEGLNWFCLAPERFEGECSPSTDVYSTAALIYQLLFGLLPYETNLEALAPDRRLPYLLRQKARPLPIPSTGKTALDARLLDVVRRGLAAEPQQRYASAQEMLDALDALTAPAAAPFRPASATPTGGGFRDVAGMDELKRLLTTSVINILRDTERARRYRLRIPNGILFYGPPGCGKSFLAEKFAEEAGYHFQLVKASDLASIYIHGSQEKIGKLFDEARKHAPTILCFDEFDALVPARAQTGAEHQAGEVNEFLTQLNNCGETGVFVIASTNRPDMIDPAILRRGRIDKVIYIPLPDPASREAIFRLHLTDRPTSDIDYARLAQLTDKYIASDIAYIVNEAAAQAAFADADITQEVLEELIHDNPPSLTPATVDSYARMREKMEGIVEQRRRIGF